MAALVLLVILLASVWLLLQCDLGWELSAHGYREGAEAEGLEAGQAGEPPPHPSPFPSEVSPSLNFRVDTYPWHSAGKNPKPFVSGKPFSFMFVRKGNRKMRREPQLSYRPT